MATAAEITARIDAIETGPEYRKLNTCSRGPFENKTFQLMQLQLNTLRLQRDDLLKRENPGISSPIKAASPLVLPSDKKHMDVLTSPTKAIPDPPAERKPIFQAKVRSAHLQAPTGPKVHRVTGTPQQGLVVVPANNVLPPPVDTSMPAARKGPSYSMPEHPPRTGANSSDEPAVTVNSTTGKLVKTPTTIMKPQAPGVKASVTGRVVPPVRKTSAMHVIKPKGLVRLEVVEPVEVASPNHKTKDDPERAAARKALTTEVETVDYLDEMGLDDDMGNMDDDVRNELLIEEIMEDMRAESVPVQDNIIGETSAIDDIDGINLEQEPEPERMPEPVPVPEKKPKKAAAKKSAGKKSAGKKLQA